jgi:hypothetical protein
MACGTQSAAFNPLMQPPDGNCLVCVEQLTVQHASLTDTDRITCQRETQGVAHIVPFTSAISQPRCDLQSPVGMHVAASRRCEPYLQWLAVGS